MIKLVAILVIISLLVAGTITSVILSSRSHLSESLNDLLAKQSPNRNQRQTDYIKIIYKDTQIRPSYNKGKQLPNKCCDTRDLGILGGKKSTPYSHPWLALLNIGQ